MDEYSLQPKDIRSFPADLKVEVKPMLPQALISEGQFWDRMWVQGHVTRRTVLEKGMHKDQPEQEMWDRELENLQGMLRPLLYEDVLRTVGALPPVQPQLVGPDGKPIKSLTEKGPGGVQALMAGNGDQGEAGQAMGGYTRMGVERQPPEEAGALPPEGPQ